MAKKLLILIFALPILVSGQVDYTITRNYPNIDKPIQFHFAPKVDIYDLGGLLRFVVNTNIDIKNSFTLQAALGIPLLQFGTYSSTPPAAISSKPERLASYHNMGLTWYFFQKIKNKEIKLAFSRVNKNYQDIKVSALVSRSWGLRFGNTGYQQKVEVSSDYFYAINPAEQNDSNDLQKGETFTFQNGSIFYAGIDFRKIMNSIYRIDGKRKVSVRTITDFYLDFLYSTGITYNDIVTVNDNKVWRLNLWDENYHKTGWLAGFSVRKPQGNGTFARIELGLRPKKGPYHPGFISLTLGWGFGAKSKFLIKNS